MIRIFEKRLPRERDFDVVGEGIALAQVAELTELPAERALVSARHAVGTMRTLGRARPRVLERGGPSIVVHEVARALVREAELPARRKW